MKIVKLNNWKLEIDDVRTKQYYSDFVKDNSQAHRNFVACLESMTKDEKDFFDSLGIHPECYNNMSNWVEDGSSYYSGDYYICAKYLEYPKEFSTPAIELEHKLKNNIDLEYTDNSIYVGRFHFKFQCEAHSSKDIPEDLPEGFICLEFSCENMEWLLDEEPENTWENILKRDAEEAEIKYANFKNGFLEFFKQNGISFIELDAEQINEYRENWLREYAPNDVDFSEILNDCHFRLWHMFSFDYIKEYLEHQSADNAFDNISKNKCVLTTNEFDNFAFVLENADALTAEIVRDLTGYYDITLSAFDFSWTYSKTHEEEMGIGPYFYQRV